MQPLKETKVYIPIDVNVEFPKYNGNYFVLRNSKVSPKEVDFLSGELGFTPDDKITHWLREQTGYFLTKQEMEELLKQVRQDGIDASIKGYAISNNRYVNKLLNNE